MMHKLLMLTLCVGLFIGTLPGCTAVQPIPDEGDGRAFLRLDVEPATTRIFIDSEYQGIVEGWVQQTLPLDPGHRMVELRADGFITRRFDVEIDPGQHMTLEVQMERELEDPK